MVAFVALAALVAIVSLGLSLRLYQRVLALERRVASAERLNTVVAPDDFMATVLEAPKPLAGLRIAIAVTQDHAHPVFATLLRDQLLGADVAEVIVLPESDGGGLVEQWRAGKRAEHLLIAGSLTCNGYAEVYYQAEFTCYTATEAVCTVIERPPGGDRPENLARELVAKVGATLDGLTRRSERRRAIGELRDLEGR